MSNLRFASAAAAATAMALALGVLSADDPVGAAVLVAAGALFGVAVLHGRRALRILYAPTATARAVRFALAVTAGAAFSSRGPLAGAALGAVLAMATSAGIEHRRAAGRCALDGV